MIINTKFSLKDKVYYMENNKVTSGIIKSISYTSWIYKKEFQECSIHYGTGNNTKSFPELLLFKSKQELLKTL